MNSRGKLAKAAALSSVLLLVDNIVRLGMITAVALLMARMLGPEQFGVLNLVSACVAIAWGVANFGLEVPVTARLAAGASPSELLGTAVLLRALTSALALAGLMVASVVFPLTDAAGPAALQVASLGVLGASLFILDSWFKARADALLPSIARTISTLIAIALRLSLLLMGFGIVAIASTIALEGLLAGIAMLIVFAKSNDAPSLRSLRFSLELLGQLTKSGWPYFTSAVGMAVMMKLDMLVLGGLSDSRSVGVYSVAQKLSEMLYIVPIVILDSLYPMLAKAQANRIGKTIADDQIFFDVTTAAAIILMVLGLTFGESIILAMFGEKYSESVAIFYIHVWTIVPIALHASRQRWLAMRGLHRWAAIPVYIGLIVNLMLTTVLIPLLGPIGAAISAVLSYTVFAYGISFVVPALRQVASMQTASLFPWVRLLRHLADWRKG